MPGTNPLRTRSITAAPTVRGFLLVLRGLLAEHDRRLEPLHPNPRRLKFHLGALGRVEGDLSRDLDSSDPESLGRLKVAVGRHFAAEFGPSRRLFSMVDEYVSTGTVPRCPTSRPLEF